MKEYFKGLVYFQRKTSRCAVAKHNFRVLYTEIMQKISQKKLELIFQRIPRIKYYFTIKYYFCKSAENCSFKLVCIYIDSIFI